MSIVRVVERVPGRIGGTTMICRTCHALKWHSSTRWREQTTTPAVGAAMMPFLPDNALPADWCIVTWLASEPPLLIPTVPAAFEPDLVVGQRATFLVKSHRRQFISAKVAYFGENEHGERGYVALTEQGITVRGWTGVYPRSGGGTESFWDVCIFGLEAHLVQTVASHRRKYPREVPPSATLPAMTSAIVGG